MCCTDARNPAIDPYRTNRCIGFSPVDCGCGCIGKGQQLLSLEHYQDHLKAELKSIERRINALNKTEA